MTVNDTGTAPMVPSRSFFVASSDVVSSNLSEEIILLNLVTGQYFSTNRVGAAIWSVLSTPASIESIVAHVVYEFDVSPEQCRDDVLRLVLSMEAAGIARRLDDSP